MIDLDGSLTLIEYRAMGSIAHLETNRLSISGLDSESVPSPTPPPQFRQTTPLSGTNSTGLSEMTSVSGSPALLLPPQAPQAQPLPPPAAAAAAAAQQQQQQQQHGTQHDVKGQPYPLAAANHGADSIQNKLTSYSACLVSDMLPGYSPWMRNAGRKKSHPVWEFFKDLKDTNGVGGVICLHCSWQGDDRSPNNLRTHLKKFHSSDGVFARFSEKLAQVSILCLSLLLSSLYSMDASPSTSSMADDVMAVDVLSSLLNPFDSSSNDVKKKGQKSAKTCKKSSEIWDHYRLLNENQNVECVYCWKVLKRGDSSTKSMWGHMTAFHQDVLDDKQSRKKLRVMAVEPIERKKYTTTDAEVGGALFSECGRLFFWNRESIYSYCTFTNVSESVQFIVLPLYLPVCFFTSNQYTTKKM
ncbi:unnamed protein product [Haemonchus placei]|uniref:BED-type domain-containing protein n=1 Tax=Haemonchus placei TaxID=6290 RepID=A0A0N4X4X6_HAEPC|nr:unnamed protein product [Haemonchus placei]